MRFRRHRRLVSRLQHARWHGHGRHHRLGHWRGHRLRGCVGGAKLGRWRSKLSSQIDLLLISLRSVLSIVVVVLLSVLVVTLGPVLVVSWTALVLASPVVLVLRLLVAWPIVLVLILLLLRVIAVAIVSLIILDILGCRLILLHRVEVTLSSLISIAI